MNLKKTFFCFLLKLNETKITSSILGYECIIQLTNLFLCWEVISRELRGSGARPHSSPALSPAEAWQRDSQHNYGLLIKLKYWLMSRNNIVPTIYSKYMRQLLLFYWTTQMDHQYWLSNNQPICGLRPRLWTEFIEKETILSSHHLNFLIHSCVKVLSKFIFTVEFCWFQGHFWERETFEWCT